MTGDEASRRRVRWWVGAVCLAAIGAASGSVWAILVGALRAGGALAAAGGALLVVGSALAAPEDRARERVALRLTERVFDGTILAAVAWALRRAEPGASAGALVVLAGWYLAAYVRARGSALGYEVGEAPWSRAVLVGLVSTSLVWGWLPWGLLAAGGWAGLVALVRVGRVLREERA